MVKISICIPTYNNVSEVEHLLDSVLEQDYKDYELNISDDSTNEEIALSVASYKEKFRAEQIELRYIHNVKPLGHIFNWNAAIRMAKGEYIKIMFSDDWFTTSHSLAQFARMLDENPKADIAFSGSRQVLLMGHTGVKRSDDSLKNSSYDRHASDEFIEKLRQDYRYLFTGNQIGAPSAVIYRRGKNLFLFDEKSNWASDMFLYFDILSENTNFAYTREPLISIGIHENQYTEGFSERDMRIYNDYRYLYTKYGLMASKECQEYFLKNYIVKYHQKVDEAKTLGINGKNYWKASGAELLLTIKCFLKSRLKRS